MLCVCLVYEKLAGKVIRVQTDEAETQNAETFGSKLSGCLTLYVR
jgi:hypothetical protein